MSTACSASPLATATRSDNDSSPSIAVHAPRPPKVLARGPLWARLPSLRPTTLSGSQSQAPAGSQAIAVPNESQNTGISFSDRVGSTRVLLQDTQACIQKLSARMDTIATRNEQAVKEVELSRAAIDTCGDRMVAEVTDAVNRSHLTHAGNFESQAGTLSKMSEKLSHISDSLNAFNRLYDAQSASLSSLNQTAHEHSALLASLQANQFQIISAVSPLEPLLRSVPTYIDGMEPRLTEAIEKALHRVLPGMLETLRPEKIPAHELRRRGTKRAREEDGGITAATSAQDPTRTLTSLAAWNTSSPTVVDTTTVSSSSPPISRTRSRSRYAPISAAAERTSSRSVVRSRTKENSAPPQISRRRSVLQPHDKPQLVRAESKNERIEVPEGRKPPSKRIRTVAHTLTPAEININVPDSLHLDNGAGCTGGPASLLNADPPLNEPPNLAVTVPISAVPPASSTISVSLSAKDDETSSRVEPATPSKIHLAKPPSKTGKKGKNQKPRAKSSKAPATATSSSSSKSRASGKRKGAVTSAPETSSRRTDKGNKGTTTLEVALPDASSHSATDLQAFAVAFAVAPESCAPVATTIPDAAAFEGIPPPATTLVESIASLGPSNNGTLSAAGSLEQNGPPNSPFTPVGLVESQTQATVVVDNAVSVATQRTSGQVEAISNPNPLSGAPTTGIQGQPTEAASSLLKIMNSFSSEQSPPDNTQGLVGSGLGAALNHLDAEVNYISRGLAADDREGGRGSSCVRESTPMSSSGLSTVYGRTPTLAGTRKLLGSDFTSNPTSGTSGNPADITDDLPLADDDDDADFEICSLFDFRPTNS